MSETIQKRMKLKEDLSLFNELYLEEKRLNSQNLRKEVSKIPY